MENKKGFIITLSGILLMSIISVLTKLNDSKSSFNMIPGVIIFSVIGVLVTLAEYKKADEEIKEGLIIQAVIIALGLLFGKSIIWLIIIGVVLVIFFAFSGGGIPFIDNLVDGAGGDGEMSSVNRQAEENAARAREAQEGLQEATGLDRSDIHVNSDGTMYHTGDGNWKKISQDGSMFEDDNGDWNNMPD